MMTLETHFTLIQLTPTITLLIIRLVTIRVKCYLARILPRHFSNAFDQGRRVRTPVVVTDTTKDFMRRTEVGGSKAAVVFRIARHTLGQVTASNTTFGPPTARWRSREVCLQVTDLATKEEFGELGFGDRVFSRSEFVP